MKASPVPPNLATILLTASAPVVWGSTYLVTTEFLPESKPLTSAVIRTVPAGLILIGLTRCFVPSLHWGRLLILSFLNIGAFQSLLFVAAYRLPGGIAAVVGAFQPLMILALAWGVDRQRPRRATMGTALGGVAGMALLFAAPGVQWDIVGLSAAVAGTTSMALGTFLSRRWQNEMPLLGFTGWQLSLGGLALLPLAIFLEDPPQVLTAANWLGYGYLSIVGTLIAYSLWFRGISRLSPVAVSALGLLSPLIAITLGWAFLGEALGAREGVGILFVLASIASLQLVIQAVPAPVKPPARVDSKLDAAA